MARKFNLLFSTILLAPILLNLPCKTRSDDPCPYPCFPPPIGPGVTPTPQTPATTTPPSQSGSSSYNYPPPSYGYIPPPAGTYFPYNPPQGNGFYPAPPPPDPILPYFPFFYKEPLHRPADSSSRKALRESTVVIAASASVLAFAVMRNFGPR